MSQQACLEDPQPFPDADSPDTELLSPPGPSFTAAVFPIQRASKRLSLSLQDIGWKVSVALLLGADRTWRPPCKTRGAAT
jgi:hypothetical protein